MRLTDPVQDYAIDVGRQDDGSFYVWDRFWDPLRPDVEGEVSDPVGTDRRAVADEEISVTPLQVGQQTVDRSAVESLPDRFQAEVHSGRTVD